MPVCAVLLCCRLNKTYVALKVIKSAKHYTEAAIDEIDLLTVISKNDPTGMFGVLLCCLSFRQ